MKKNILHFFLILGVLLLSTPFVQADDQQSIWEAKTFDSTELFPTWTGAKDPQKYLTEEDLVTFNALQTNIKSGQNSLNQMDEKISVLQEKLNALQNESLLSHDPQDYSQFPAHVDLSNAYTSLRSLMEWKDGQAVPTDTEAYEAVKSFIRTVILPQLIQEIQNEIDSFLAERSNIIGNINFNKDAIDELLSFRVRGIEGRVGDGKLLMHYLPRLIDILLKFVAPLVLIMFLYSGIRFIYAGDDEEDLTQSKQFFMYSLMGVLFVILSYSIIKAFYFILSTT